MKHLLIALLLITPFSMAETLVFKDSGFTIKSLESTQTDTFYQPLAMTLPAKDGLTSNVIVQIQPSTVKDLQEYKTLTEKELKSFNIEIIRSEVRKDGYIFEYINVLKNGVKLHGYSKAIKKGSVVYLATGTASVKEWKTLGDKIKTSVDALALIDTP